jgi:hypothetical protein
LTATSPHPVGTTALLTTLPLDPRWPTQPPSRAKRTVLSQSRPPARYPPPTRPLTRSRTEPDWSF